MKALTLSLCLFAAIAFAPAPVSAGPLCRVAVATRNLAQMPIRAAVRIARPPVTIARGVVRVVAQPPMNFARAMVQPIRQIAGQTCK